MATEPPSVGNNFYLNPLDANTNCLAYNYNFINIKSVEPSFGIPTNNTFADGNVTYYVPLIANAPTYIQSRRLSNNDHGLTYFNNNIGLGTDTPNERLTVVGKISGTQNIIVGPNNTSSGYYSSILGGQGNTISGYESVIASGSYNTILGQDSFIGTGTNNVILSAYGYIGGGFYNQINNASGIIAGGTQNVINGNASNINGGGNNLVGGAASTISGGNYNRVNGDASNIGGGFYNSIDKDNSTISGGYNNCLVQNHSFIGGGYRNCANSDYAVIGGGYCNTASNYYASFIGGGGENKIYASSSAIIGGYSNTASGYYSYVGAGQFNCTYESGDVVAGGQNNCANGPFATTIGGFANCTLGNGSTVGGGNTNAVAGAFSTIAGGCNNSITGYFGLIGGGTKNILVNSNCSGILGGSNNNLLNSTNSFIIGSNLNVDSINNTTFVNNLSVVERVTSDLVITGNVEIDKNLFIYGAISALGGVNYTTTTYSETTAIRIVNTGLGPALYVEQQFGTYNIAEFVSNQGSQVLHIGNTPLDPIDGTTGFVGINTPTPNLELTVNGSISSNKTIYTNGGNSDQWNSAYQSLSSVPYVLVQPNLGIKPAYGNNNTVSGQYSNIGGGSLNSALSSHSVVAGGCNNHTFTSNSTIGGGYGNSASGYASTVAGGKGNKASGDFSVSSGWFSCATGNYSNVSGGANNKATGNNSNISGGYNNCATAPYSTVSGGYDNCATAPYSTVSGGYDNTASGYYNSTTVGGRHNRNNAYNGFIGGGSNNTASLYADYSVVVGGLHNNVNGGRASFIAAGEANNTNNNNNVFILGSSLTANQADFTYVNNISSQGIVSTPNGDSNLWNSTYSTVSGLSANLTNTINQAISSVVSSLSTEFVLINGSYSDPTWIVSLSDSKIFGTNRNNWDSVYSDVYSFSASWSNGGTVSQLSANWNSVYSTVSTLSGNWNSAYTTLSGLSANLSNTINQAISSVVNTLSTEFVLVNGSYSDPTWIVSLSDSKIFGTNRNNWDSVYSDVNEFSGNWQSAYWATTGLNTNLSNYLPLSGGTLSGPLIINSDLNVTGSVNFTGSATYINSVNSVIGDSLVYIASANPANLNDIGIVGQFTQSPIIDHQHTGIVRRADTQKWTFFSGITSNSISAVNLAWSDSSFKVDTLVANIEAPNVSTTNLIVNNSLVYTSSATNSVGINTTTPNANLTVLGSISASGLIYGSGFSSTAGVVQKYKTNIGDNSNKSFTLSHGLATQDVITQVYDANTNSVVYPTIVNNNTSSVTITFSFAPTFNQYRVVILG